LPRQTVLAFALLALWLFGIALIRPLSVDESQYVAATALTANGLLPYRDFAYLQTPLQPFVFAPLEGLFAGHLLLAMRMANALLGVATVIFVYAAARRAGANDRLALVAAMLLVACESFSWCAGVARNDMLPAILMMAGLWAIASSGRGGHWLIAGLAFGLAASAKISYAVPAAAVFLADIWTSDAIQRRRALVFAAGVTVGLLPTLSLAVLAPRAFLTEVIVFPATGPVQYYTGIGKAWRLGPERFIGLLEAAAVGPALIAAIEVMRRLWAEPERWWGNPARRAMIAAFFGGLLSAALNRPFQIFYLLPALPPLFILVALLFSQRPSTPRWLQGVWLTFVCAGLIPVAGWMEQTRRAGISPALDAERRSDDLEAALRVRAEGPVATLAAQYLGAAKIDPRFAAGPFLYRTRGFVSLVQAREWHVVTGDQNGTLAERPPAAFVTGDYLDAEPAQEMGLANQARALGYRPAAKAAGFTIWTRRP
jgi:hypothetical protein